MVQKLLSDRFRLAFHREKKEQSVYAITIAKNGPKLTKSESPLNLPGFGLPPRRMIVRNATMEALAHVLQANLLEQPVVDQTGLGSTRYDFILNYTPDLSQLSRLGAPQTEPQPRPGDADAPPDLFTAFQQQLGLEVKSIKAPADVLVIDRAEKPSEN